MNDDPRDRHARTRLLARYLPPVLWTLASVLSVHVEIVVTRT